MPLVHGSCFSQGRVTCRPEGELPMDHVGGLLAEGIRLVQFPTSMPLTYISLGRTITVMLCDPGRNKDSPTRFVT